MAQRLLKAEISRVGDEKFCVVMSQNILLGEEFSNQHVVRFPLHLIRFPFHQHFLLQLTQGGEQGLLLVLGDLQTSLVRGGNAEVRYVRDVEHQVGLQVAGQVEPNLVTKCWVDNHRVPPLVHAQQLLQSVGVRLHGEIEEVCLQEISASEQMLGCRHIRPVPASQSALSYRQ